MSYQTRPYQAGQSVQKLFEGRRLDVLESELTHPTHSDGFVDQYDPVLWNEIPGVAMASAAAATDYVAVDLMGIYSLPVVASDHAGTLALSAGDPIYISSAGVLSADFSGRFFGFVLHSMSASAAAANACVLVGGVEPDLNKESETVVAAAPTLKSYGASLLDSSATAITATLGSGAYVGQLKTIVMTDASNSSTVSATNHETSDPEVATFDAVDETWVLVWTGTEWATVKATCTFV